MSVRKINPKKSPRHFPAAASSLRAATSSIFDANRVLFDHACATLPDSLSSRRLVLKALKLKTHPRQPAYLQICAQLAALESIAELHTQLQAELRRALPSSTGSHREIAR